MTSHVSNAILLLIRFVFVDEECVYRISINIMNEMEKKDGNLVFLKEKLSLFIQRLGFNKVHTSCISRFFFNPYLKPLATPHNCVCVCAGICVIDRSIAEYFHCATRDLVAPKAARCTSTLSSKIPTVWISRAS